MNDLSLHPTGAAKKPPESDCRALVPAEGPVVLNTFGGRVHVEWDPSAAVTPLGQLAFFAEYLKVGDLFEPWVEQCPVSWTSNNAPNKRDVLGTAVLSILCGHQRYAHINAVRGDTINAALLGMEKVVSEDSVRRMLLKLDETEGVAWLQRYLLAVSEPLLGERGFSIPMSPSSRSSVTRKGRCSVITRTNRGVRRTATIPTSSPICASRWTLRFSPAIKPIPNTARPGCGSCLSASAARTGRHWCAVTVTGAPRRTCSVASKKVSTTCSSSA